MKKVLTFIGSILIFLISVSLLISYLYSQRYVQDSPVTATKGILFQSTLNLTEYRNISSGNGFLGKFGNYSRSDRHDEVLTIYCKDYCKK